MSRKAGDRTGPSFKKRKDVNDDAGKQNAVVDQPFVLFQHDRP